MKEDLYKCELDESFTEEQNSDKEKFLENVFELQFKYGFNHPLVKEFLYAEIDKRPHNYYAYDFLYKIYKSEFNIDKARGIAWQLISLKDCSFFRNYLQLLEIPMLTYINIYYHGDKSKLPQHIINEIESM